MRAKSELGVLAAVLLFCRAGFPGWAAPADPQAALLEGNRRFAKDEIPAALEAYARGYTAKSAGGGSMADGMLAHVLAYNAGTCALQLGRLPEALLWYRRAEIAMPDDPWLRDNLALTRHALGGSPEEKTRWTIWLGSPLWLAVAGVALAWMALGVLVFAPRPRRGTLAGIAAIAMLACAAFAAGFFPDRFGPRAAVLLAACPPQGGGLPAGSEVRVRPSADGGWRIVGERPLRCPAAAVGLVEP